LTVKLSNILWNYPKDNKTNITARRFFC